MIQLVRATTPDHFAQGGALFREYAGSLGIDLCFQSFEQELATLPTMYGPPGGWLFLAEDDETNDVLGCIGLRALSGGVAEMKRLYVRPAARGRGLGRMLATAVLDVAREVGYRCVRLDTLPSMAEAQELYRCLGFVEIPPYYPNPVPGARYLELALLPGLSPE
jgi:putative acetyltransferase